MIEDHIRRAVERAIHDAEHPRGMGIHDGKAKIEASYLRRMLAMLAAAPTPPAQDDPLTRLIRTSEELGAYRLPQQDDEALVLTERQKAIVSFALWRFINDSYSQATYYAQKGPVEHVSRFQDDAKDAEAIRALLAKRGAA